MVSPNSQGREIVPAPASEVHALAITGHVHHLELASRWTRSSGLMVSGRVDGPAGERIPAGWVSCQGTNSYLRRTQIDSGTFSIGDLEPGEYVLRAGAPPEFGESDPLSVQAGDGSVRVVLKRTGRISGSVTTARGVPEDRARLTITRRADGESSRFSETDSEGVFQIAGLDTGVYDLFALSQDGLVGVRGSISVGSGAVAEGIAIQVSDGAHLSVENRITGTYGQVTVFCDDICVASQCLVGGTVNAFIVPPGRIRVRLLQDQKAVQVRECQAGIGDEQGVVFDDRE
jgi:hypothetical protein